jgi:hypothetical protein
MLYPKVHDQEALTVSFPIVDMLNCLTGLALIELGVSFFDLKLLGLNLRLRLLANVV